MGLSTCSLALALLACKDKPSEPTQQQADKCDQKALASLVETLAAAETDARVGLVAPALIAACPRLPSPIVSSLRWATEPDDGELRMLDVADPEFLRAKQLACPKLGELDAKLGDAPSSERAKMVFDTCDFARYDLITREQAGPGWITWTTHALLLEDGVPVATAKPISQAVALLERSLFSPVLIHAQSGQRFAKVTTANELPGGLVITATTTDLIVYEMPVAQLDDGALAPSAVEHHRILALYEFLIEEAEKGQAVAESQKTEWDARAILAFDERVRFGTVVDTLYTAGRAGYTQFAFVVEPHPPTKRVLHVSPPRFEGLSAPQPPSLKVFIIEEGFWVRMPGDTENRELSGHDLAKLAELAKQFREQHPDAIRAVVSAENSIPLSLLLAVYGTLAGPACDQLERRDCLLPELVIEAGAG